MGYGFQTPTDYTKGGKEEKRRKGRKRKALHEWFSWPRRSKPRCPYIQDLFLFLPFLLFSSFPPLV
jgi:hypothetical protein